MKTFNYRNHIVYMFINSVGLIEMFVETLTGLFVASFAAYSTQDIALALNNSFPS